jgi:hypothetical protein
VKSPQAAGEKVKWYACRWGIEVYHRILKSGCKIEERHLGAADRIQSCLAIDMVVAWRVHHATKLGRETPDVPCTVFFADHEWQALVVYRTRKLPEPDKPPSLGEATRMTAQLGGFLGRKCDGEPGTKSLWLGLQRLDDLSAMCQFMLPLVVPHPKIPPVSSDLGYGSSSGHKTKGLRKWLTEIEHLIEVHSLPEYSPKLNAGEYIWKET